MYEGVSGCKVTTYPEIEGSYPPRIKNSGEKSPLLNEAYFKETVNDGVHGCHLTTYPEIEGSYSP